MDRFRTVHAVNVTPFGEDGGVDYDALGRNVEFLISGGLEVVVPCGNTGEFYALTLEETRDVTRFVVEAANGRAAVIAGIGHDLETASRMARFAQETGADAVMIHQPPHPYMSAEGLTGYYTRIARSVDIGVVLYVRNPAIDLRVLSEVTALDNVVAVKYAINDLPRFGELVRSVDNPVVWLCGTAEMWAPFFFAAGAEGFTSGLVNIAPEKSLMLLRALDKGERRLALSLWREILPLERLRARHRDGNNVPVIKEGMKLIGLAAGRPREPISALSETDRRELVEILRAWGKLEDRTVRVLGEAPHDIPW